jgi:hypothetical protein
MKLLEVVVVVVCSVFFFFFFCEVVVTLIWLYDNFEDNFFGSCMVVLPILQTIPNTL